MTNFRQLVGLALLLCTALSSFANAGMLIGTGIADATGPITDTIMMGMANSAQVNNGLLQRLRARAFVAVDTVTNKRFCFVSLDAGMGGTVLNNRVMAELEKLYPGLYTDQNVGISGTHTHSGPSGFLQDVIFQFSGSGFQPHTLERMVDGVVKAIQRAHENLTPASASFTAGQLDQSNINRSPTSYLLNPAEERAEYAKWGGNTDHNMTMLRFKGDNGKELGMFNWFAVHPTSLNNTNLLVSGDNKGYASYLFEKYKNGPTSAVRPGAGEFVAAFASANLGDVSPNTAGPRCRDTGEPCDNAHSTCNGRNEQCSAFGPGKDMYDSCRIIGENQFKKAQELYEAPGTPVTGSIDYVHTYVKMPGLNVTDPNTGKHVGHLCKAAMGDSFAAGTTDGPGMFDFTQGANSTNPLWHWIVGFLHKSTPEEIACQEPKGILLPTGSVNVPWPWAPETLPMQILRLGNFVILVVPTEMTTMSGRRLRKHVKDRLVSKGVIGEEGMVVLAGLGNGYADYTTTFEEYQGQRYEAGSTIFGPHQLNAYIQEFLKLADAMAAGVKPNPGTPPEDFSHKIPGGTSYYQDALPKGAKAFGQVMKQPSASYKKGSMATAVFAGADPINNMHSDATFLEIQHCLDGAACTKTEVVAVDDDWESRIVITKSTEELFWKARTWEMQWQIPANAASGTYRMKHFGTYYVDPVIGKEKFVDFTGTTATFTVA